MPDRSSSPATDTSPESTAGRGQPGAPSLTLPKGGGALRGIGEKFAANPVTGTGSLSVPLAVSPGRSGFGPQLSLSYDSGSGNGPFGFGWSLSTPAISRKTDKGLPRYLDGEESDVFILSGAEDLVPVLPDPPAVPGFSIRRYRPRIEGLFARIERWTATESGDVHWRSISRDNVLTVYGKDDNSRIFDPEDDHRIFSWLICETRDDKGNAIVYEYAEENDQNVDRTQANERNRVRTANRYLKRIQYGNRVSRLIEPDLTTAGWMFEVVFDYGEHDAANPKPGDHGPWTCRNDPFSSYRAGFEVRTYRLCQRVLMFHHFPGELEVGVDCLVRSTDFTYSHDVYTFLRAVTQSGYRRHDGGYLKRSLPPVEFEYTQPVVQDTVEEVDAASLENLPIGLDGSTYQWTDLHGEGIPGILTEQAGGWFYKRNLSPIAEKRVEFAPLELVATRPNLALAGGQAQFMDLAGDGQPDLVVLDGPMPGFYEHDDDEGWQPFRPFTSRLNRDTRDPNLKFVDLDGDGHADVLITEDDAFVWHPSLAEEGFAPARRVAQALDEERGPRLVFADGTQSIYLADMSGDGLTDLVRLRNGEVCYWPNHGYGRFGAKVTMDHAPQFDNPDQFDHRRIRLADVDGTGTTDVIYLHRDGVRLCFNQSGNRWSEPQPLNVFPRVDDLVSIMPTDLLGNGTACLVWSSPLPGDARQQMRYVDLMGGQKPYLLVKTINNLGAETLVEYSSSTRFYLQDKRDGRPWITKLPFPVHVVERVETRDLISGNRFVTRYVYHHGYFDGEEREFRGFGRVDQWDTEEFSALTGDGTLPEATNIDTASHVPPVLTKTWFHTGVYLGRDHVSDFFAGLLNTRDRGEYYREPELTDEQARDLLLPDTALPTGLTVEEEREACRALKGSMLRQEIYALDGTTEEPHPYIVNEQNFTIRRLQPRDGNRHTVFFTHPREAIKYHYERNPTDPRVSHALTLEVDPYGNVLKEVAVGYDRRTVPTDPALTDADRAQQTRLLITYTENRLTNPVLTADQYRTPLAAETRMYELTGLEPENGAVRFSFEEWTRNDFALPASAVEIPYEQTADGITLQKRLIEHVRTLYRRDDLTAFSPLAEVEPLALPGESYKLALTPGLLAHVFKRKRTGQPDEDLLPGPAPLLEGIAGDQGGYIAMDGAWWIPAGRSFFDPDANTADPALTAAHEQDTAQKHFYLPRKVVDPFGHRTLVEYDGHDLLVTRTRDALDNTVTAVNDYRVLQPRLVTDPNRNRNEVAFDTLGLVVATAVMGKVDEGLGDLLEDFDADPPLTSLQAFMADPRAQAASLLGKASTRIVYDLERYQRTGQPPFAATLARETHFFDPLPADGLKIQISVSYSDGFGREIQKKIQAEPGPVVAGGPDVDPRWVGSGWTIFNNKGKPVRQYEPFFSPTHDFQFARIEGVGSILFYDPVERVVATLHPNHTWEKVVFDAWQQATWDVNDTVLETDPKNDPHAGDFFRRLPDSEYLPAWHTQRIGRPVGDSERDAAEKAAAHAGTPTTAHFDTLGRPFLTFADNGPDPANPSQHMLFATRVELDIEGNQRAVIDAQDRIVMRYDYDLLGNRIHQASMEAGERWMLNDVTGKPVRTWDSRDHRFLITYDALRRPLESSLHEGAGPEFLIGRTVYGESRTNPEANNLRGKTVEVCDQAGMVTSDEYDFKGNLLRSQRQLARVYNSTLNWSDTVPLEADLYVSRIRYDALNRPTELSAPDGSVIRPGYNDANLLERVEANLRGAAAVTHFVTNIDYDAKGQRTRIDYGTRDGSGISTTYDYDRETFRLIQLTTRRNASSFDDSDRPGEVQSLHYTYDPAGNITHIRDDAQQSVYFRNRLVEPSAEYTYDALYRLIEATGREHLGQVGGAPIPHSYNDAPRVGINWSANDGNAMGRYLERYVYDAAGNILEMQHRGTDPANPGWTRAYTCIEPSQIEPGKQSNRLTSTTIGDTTETYSTSGDGYDAHGNMLRMPHLQVMQWDFKDRLQMTGRQAVNATDTDGIQHHGERTWYVYDSAGQRVRKVTELASGEIKDERIYLGGFEIYRRNGMNPLVRETLHIMDDKQRIALVETRTRGTEPGVPELLIHYQLSNHLGSASLELDDQAQIISYEEYTPYGSASYQAVRSKAEAPKRYRYTGKERDEESGLHYHGVRYYAAWLGRWLSADPQGLVDGPNVYAYGRRNPVVYADPTGTQCDPTTQSCVDPTTSTQREEALQQSLPADERHLPAVSLQRSVSHAPSTTRSTEQSISPPPASETSSSQDTEWTLFDNPIWNTVTNNAVSSTTGLLENAWIGIYTLPTLTRGLMSVGGARGLEMGLRLEDMLAAPASAAPALLAPSSALGQISRASAVLAPLGAVSNLMSFYDALYGPNGARSSGLERIGDATASGAGFISSAVGTAGLAGAGLQVAGATTLGETLVAGAIALGPQAAIAGAGAGGYALGRLGDQTFSGLMNTTGAGSQIDRWREIHRLGGQSGDYSISGMGAEAGTAVDQEFTSTMRDLGVFDQSRPAYTQTFGWWLADSLPSWLQ